MEVLKTLKANGENAQISWNPEANAWIIASKNVGIALRSKEDIDRYPAERNKYALEIAKVWFNKLEDLKE